MNDTEDKHTSTTQPLAVPRDLTEDIPTTTSVPVGETSGWEGGEEEPAMDRIPLQGEGTIQVRHFGEKALDQDRIITPVPLAPPPEATWTEPRRARSSCALRLVVALCLVIGLLSLALNAFLIYSLMNTRQTATEGLDAALAALDNFGGEGFHYDYHLEKTIPVSASIPIEQDMVIPFKGEFPIHTTVEVPIDTGVFGTVVVQVPINTSVPVSVSVPIHVDQTFQVSTTFPVSMTIPIDVKPDDPEIQRLLSGVREWLVRLRSTFY
jgi:hypothetical protein